MWGAQPADLDAHLSGPVPPPPPGVRFTAFPLAPSPQPYVTMAVNPNGDVDDQDGFGPERIVVTPNPATPGQYVPGEYRFWAHNFNGAIGPSFTGSLARVIVNRDGVLLGVFDISGATGDPNLLLWHVVNVQIDEAGNVTVVPIQSFTNGDSSTVLSVPYGPKPRRR